MTCNRDCFNCPYEDCIVDDISYDEYKDSVTRDIKILFAPKPEIKSKRGRKKTLTFEQELLYRKNYYKKNGERIREYSRARYLSHKDVQYADGTHKCNRCKNIIPANDSHELCEVCREKKRIYQQKKRMMNKEIV